MNFFQQRREFIGLSQRKMATRIGVSNEAVRQWEDDSSVPQTPIAVLATAYQVSETKMEREVMALRRRLEATKAEAGAGK